VSVKSSLTYIQKYKTGFYLLLILLLTFLVYSSSIFNGFLIWDDDLNVYQNPAITSLSFAHIKQYFSSFYIGMYQPLTTLSFALNFKFTGMNPAGFHAGNLFFHLLNTLLVFIIIRGITKKSSVALLTALFFGIHPMFVESVAWVSERKDVLYSFFFLLSLVFYVEYVRKDKGFIFLLLSLLMFICSVLSKSTAILLPAILLLLDWFLKRKFCWKQISEKIPFLIISIIIAGVTLHSQYATEFKDLSAYQFNLFDRFFLSAYSILFYLIMFFFPVNFSAIHPYPVKSGLFLPLQYYLAFVALIILLICLFQFLKNRQAETKRLIIFGISFFIIMLILFIQIIPLPGFSVTAERYSYMPFIGLFFLFSMIISNFFERFESQKNRYLYALYLVISIFVVFYSVTTYNRNKVWKSNFTVFSDAIKKHPHTAMPYNNRGLAYSQSGNLSQAISDFTRAIEINPDHSSYRYNRANAFLAEQNYPMAIQDYTAAIRSNPHDAEASYINRGIAFQESGFAISSYCDLSAAIKLKGKFTSIAYFNRGNTRQILNDKKGACSDWQISLNMGYDAAQQQLLKYCR
jgi:protein O-mannosyl-transferase